MRGAYESGAQPELQDDGTYHLPTRDSRNGRILKKSVHPTYWKGLEIDAGLDYNPYFFGDVTYTWNDKDGALIPWEKVEQFQDGGDNTPMYQEESYQGPTYEQVLQSLKEDNPNIYNRLAEAKARAQHSTSEIVPYIDANGKINTVGNASGLTEVYPEFDILASATGLPETLKHVVPVTKISKQAQKVFQDQIIPRRISKLSADFNNSLNSSNNKDKLVQLIKRLQKEGIQIDYSKSNIDQQLQELFSTVSNSGLTVKDAILLTNFFKTQDNVRKLRAFANNPNNFRYRTKPALFNKDKNITGEYDPSTDIVTKVSTAGDETLIHEFRHRLDNKVPLTGGEENVLYKAYDRSIYPGEQVSTNSELRYNLLKQFNKEDLNVTQQNKFLESFTSDELQDALERVNGYGREYVQNFDRKNLLDALTKVGVTITPISMTVDQYAEGGEVPPSGYQGSNEPVYVNPFTRRPLANGSITPVFNIEDAANLTPAGDILSIRDAYVAAKNRDLLGLGLAGLGFLPFVPRIGRSKVSKVGRPPIPEVHPNYFQKQMEKAERAAAKRKQTVNDFYTQQDQTYESLIENEDAFRRAVNADVSAGTNYTGVYGDYLRNYSESSSRYNDKLTSIRLTDDIPNEAKAQVDPRNLNWIRVNSRYADPDELDPVFQQMNPGLVRHELGHVTDEKAGLDYVNKLGDRSKFESESKLKEMFPKTYKRVQDYLLRGSEIKSHMNEFREYLYSVGQYSPTETAKSLRQKLDKYGSNFKNLKILFDAYKNKRQFARDYNTIPLIGTSALGINYYLNQEEQRRD